jgi:hypothetical protein
MEDNESSTISLSSLIDEYKNFLNDKYKKIELIEKSEDSLYEFLKQAWPIIEPDKFIDGWHLEAMSEHIEALMKREIKNLLINIPPRSGKSTLISVILPAWRWLKNPSERFVYASHAKNISLKDSINCRRLILSDWYKQRWGETYSLVGDQNTKGRFDNDKSGYRISTSVGSSFTGDGGTTLVCLPYDVKITTDKGEIYIGEIYYDRLPVKILSYNDYYDRTEYKEIEVYECNGKKEILEIELDDRTLQCTEDHPIYVKGIGYIPAKYVQPGHVLFCI